MFKNTLQVRKGSLLNQQPFQVKIEQGANESTGPKSGRPALTKLKKQQNGQENKENQSDNPAYGFRKTVRMPAWQKLAQSMSNKPFGSSKSPQNRRSGEMSELVCKEEWQPEQSGIRVKTEPEAMPTLATLSANQRPSSKAGRPSRSPGDHIFNISKSQIEHFLQCAGERWLTGNEYANLLIHSETLGPMLGIETIPGIQHPPSIYFAPKNGTIYFLKNVPDVKKLGFPPIFQDRQSGGNLKKVNTKHICWKRMNFVTQIPKCSPKVEYVVASGRSSKLKLSSESSLVSSSEGDTFYRMHIVWLYNSEISSESSQSSSETGPMTVLCHILQISSSNGFTVKIEEEEDRFDATPIRPAPNKNMETRHAMTVSHFKPPSPPVTFTPLAKRKPVGRKQKWEEPSTACKQSEPQALDVKIEEGALVAPACEKSPVKKDANSPMIFKWKSTCKRSTQEACSARLSTLFGIQWSNTSKDQDQADVRSRFAQEDCRQIRRVLFEPNVDQIDSFHRFEGLTSLEASDNRTRSRETSCNQALSAVDYTTHGGFRLPESEYKKLLRLDDIEGTHEAGVISNYQSWSPSLKFAQAEPLEQTGFSQSQLRTNSRDCNQALAIGTMWPENYNMRTPEALARYSGSKMGSQVPYNASLQTPTRPSQPFPFSDTWRSQTHHKAPIPGPIRPQPPQSPHKATPLPLAPAHSTPVLSPHQQPHQPHTHHHSPLGPHTAEAGRVSLLHAAHTHDALLTWQTDPRVMLVLSRLPLFVLRLADLFVVGSTVGIGAHVHEDDQGLGPQKDDGWRHKLVERLTEEAFVRFVRGIGAEEGQHIVLPPDLVVKETTKQEKEGQPKMDKRGEQHQAIRNHSTQGSSGQLHGGSAVSLPQKALEPLSSSKEPSRESRYSQWVRVMYAQKMLGLTKVSSTRKRE